MVKYHRRAKNRTAKEVRSEGYYRNPKSQVALLAVSRNPFFGDPAQQEPGTRRQSVRFSAPTLDLLYSAVRYKSTLRHLSIFKEA